MMQDETDQSVTAFVKLSVVIDLETAFAGACKNLVTLQTFFNLLPGFAAPAQEPFPEDIQRNLDQERHHVMLTACSFVSFP